MGARENGKRRKREEKSERRVGKGRRKTGSETEAAANLLPRPKRIAIDLRATNLATSPRVKTTKNIARTTEIARIGPGIALPKDAPDPDPATKIGRLGTS